MTRHERLARTERKRARERRRVERRSLEAKDEAAAPPGSGKAIQLRSMGQVERLFGSPNRYKDARELFTGATSPATLRRRAHRQRRQRLRRKRGWV
jgi:hypothetical protein